MSQLIIPGTAAASDVVSGKTFSAGTNYNASGSMPNNGAVAITPGANAQSIPAGYHNGSGTVGGVSVPVANVLAGTVIAGQTGTMTNNGAVTITPGNTTKPIPAGYHNGSGTVATDANLTAANIKSGVSIFGVAGSLVAGHPYATGTVNMSGQAFTVNGLSFTPILVVIRWVNAGNTQDYRAVYLSDNTGSYMHKLTSYAGSGSAGGIGYYNDPNCFWTVSSGTFEYANTNAAASVQGTATWYAVG